MKNVSSSQNIKKHNCEEWLEEGRGCSICSKIGLCSKKELIEVQNNINWKITDLTNRLINLRARYNKLRKKLKDLK